MCRGDYVVVLDLDLSYSPEHIEKMLSRLRQSRAKIVIASPYMPGGTEDTFDPYITTIQWSRRFTGLKVFMALAEMGAAGYRKEIEQQARMGRELKARLVQNGWKVVNESPLPVVCFTHERIESERVAITDVLNKIYEQGRHWLSEVRLPDGKRALRVCICSYRTGVSDIDLLVKELQKIISS